MGLDTVLQTLTELGIQPYLAPGDRPMLSNAYGKLTPPLKEDIEVVRPALVLWLKEQSPKRVVLLPHKPPRPVKHHLPPALDQSQAPPERVLAEGLRSGCLIESVRRLARGHPGRTVAGEWQDVRGHWQRVLWLRWPLEDADVA